MIPAPSTPSWPVSTGSASTDRNDEPPLRFRSSPHPMRMNAGRIDASSSANAAMSVAGTPVTSAVRSSPHEAAAAITSIRASRVRLDERPVDEIVLREVPHDPEHERDVGAGPQRQMPIGAPSHRRAPRIDDHEPRARSPSPLHERREVDVRDRGVRAPDDDEPAVHDVVRVGRQHRPERRLPRRAGGRRADRVEDPRRAELVEQTPCEPLGGQQSRGRVVEVGNDRRRAVLCDRGRDARRHEVERFIPRGRPELTRALRPHPHQWRHHSLGRVHPPRVLFHLGADEALREGVGRAGVDRDEAAVLHRDLERARVGAIERTRGQQPRGGIHAGSSSQGVIRAGTQLRTDLVSSLALVAEVIPEAGDRGCPAGPTDRRRR